MAAMILAVFSLGMGAHARSPETALECLEACITSQYHVNDRSTVQLPNDQPCY